MKVALVAFGLLVFSGVEAMSEEVNSKTYYISIGTAACGKSWSIIGYSEPSPEQRKKLIEKGCAILMMNDPVRWDGKKNKEGEAIVVVDGKPRVLPVPTLSEFKIQDSQNVKFVTSSTAMLCASPFKLTEAVSAAGDQSWLESIDCVKAAVGLAVIKIHPDTPSLSQPWQVRIKLPKGGVTLWGMPYAFTLPDGERIRN